MIIFARFVKDEKTALIRGWQLEVRSACRYFSLTNTESLKFKNFNLIPQSALNLDTFGEIG